MKYWNGETGEYLSLKKFWDIFGDRIKRSEAEVTEDPETWLSKPGGEYYIGISFHYPPNNFASGQGIFEERYIYKPAPFLLHSHQDPYNSWGVNARLKGHSSAGTMDYWEWYPGVMIIDTAARYTLPAGELSLYAGTEWADNDYRIFHGLYTDQAFNELSMSALRVINRVTGPGWANWPFGDRQLADAVLFWIAPESEIPELLLLASVKQHGAKFTFLDPELYDPGDRLGIWEEEIKSWDCRQAIKFLYEAKLLLKDGFPEMALTCAIASLENASAEILAYILEGNQALVDRELNGIPFLDRFDKVLPKYKAAMPQPLFAKLQQAYLARNVNVYGPRPVTPEQAAESLDTIEEVLKWYWLHVGRGVEINQEIKDKDEIPF